MKHLTVLLSTLFCASLSAQITNFTAYYAHANKGTYYFYKEKYDSAVVEFDEAFKHTHYIHGKYLGRAITSAKKAKNTTALAGFNILKSTQAVTKINAVYKGKIDSLFKVDQTQVRGKKNTKLLNEYRMCLEKKNCDSARVAFLAKKNRESGIKDSTNIAELVRLIGIYGFPSEQKVGATAYHDAIIMLAHFDYDRGNIVLGKILDAALQNGDITPKDYGWIIDRRSDTDPVYYVIPFGAQSKTPAQVEEIDKRRESIGLAKMNDSQIMVFKKKSVRVKYLD